MANELTPTEKVAQALSDREAFALRKFVSAKMPELSPELSIELFELFSQGRDCEEIRKLKPGLSLGAIVHCRVRDLWDVQRADIQRKLATEVPAKVQKVQLESADFLVKLLAASHKLLQEPIDKFLATGDKIHLKGTALENLTLKQYQSILETLGKATGQDQKKHVHHTGGITVTQRPQPTAAEASNILDAIEIK